MSSRFCMNGVLDMRRLLDAAEQREHLLTLNRCYSYEMTFFISPKLMTGKLTLYDEDFDLSEEVMAALKSETSRSRERSGNALHLRGECARHTAWAILAAAPDSLEPAGQCGKKQRASAKSMSRWSGARVFSANFTLL